MIEIMKELSDVDRQRRLWISHKDRPLSSGFDEVVHFLFDDTDLAENSNLEIGRILLNAAEAVMIKEICDLITEMIDRIGDQISMVYINDEKWNDIVIASRKFLKEMNIE
nr:hypothetical protein [Sphingobium chlorophenolicum]